jgi:hypothetical protein
MWLDHVTIGLLVAGAIVGLVAALKFDDMGVDVVHCALCRVVRMSEW